LVRFKIRLVGFTSTVAYSIVLSTIRNILHSTSLELIIER
jgi:hypothetical protein